MLHYHKFREVITNSYISRLLNTSQYKLFSILFCNFCDKQCCNNQNKLIFIEKFCLTQQYLMVIDRPTSTADLQSNPPIVKYSPMSLITFKTEKH